MNLDSTRQFESGSIAAALAGAGRRIRVNALVLGLAWWLGVSLGLWLLLCLLDNLLQLPQGFRLPAAAAAAAVLVSGFFRKIWLPSGRALPRERVALILEKRFDLAHNTLINAYQFERQDFRPNEKVLADRLIALSRNAVAQQNFAELLDRRRMVRWGGSTLGIALVWLLYAGFFPDQVWNACLRFALPLADIPPVGSVRLTVIPAADLVLNEGDSLDVRARLSEKVAWTPTILWREGARTIEPAESGSAAIRQRMTAEAAGAYGYSFNEVKRSFAFRVLAHDTYSRSVRVEVIPAPRIGGGTFTITPPAYTGLEKTVAPGPPSLLSALPGSQVAVLLDVQPAVRSLLWRGYDEAVPFAPTGRQYRAVFTVAAAGPYRVDAVSRRTLKSCTVARGQISLQVDNPPQIDFKTTDRNRFVTPGAELKLDLEAADDYGIRRIVVTVREAEQSGGRIVKQWDYLGPPGRRGAVAETLTLPVDPRMFRPASVYVLDATCADFGPAENVGQSRPIVLRVRSLDDLAAGTNDPLAQAMAVLREAVEAQRKANSITENLQVNLPEVTAKGSLAAHRAAMSDQQEKARAAAARAMTEFGRQAEGKPYANRLDPLVQGEMPWVLKDIGGLKPGAEDALRPLLDPIRTRQSAILAELIALLGLTADRSQRHPPAAAVGQGAEAPPVVSAKDQGRELKDDLEQFVSEQKRIIDKTRSLLDSGPEDLTQEEETILGELAREEAKWATFFEEKLTDFSKLPLQDFADGSLADEFNKVFMELKLASKSLYEKKIELAVPVEQSGLENAKTLVNNLERWLVDMPDHVKWNMEEPLAPTDVAIAELPAELEDMVGELLDQEEEMTDEIEDVSSSWADSIDKGAGWDTVDGPISSMSAKGITGNQLPNQHEIAGRSGEGRTGRSSGQMVSKKAEGKKGRETPTRVSPSPFEQGQVEDASQESPGGATGGGKLSGFAGEGLRGPTPPPAVRQKLARLAGQQAQIRQEAEPLSLKLRAYHLPSGDLETAVANMRRFEEEAKKGYGPGVRQAFSRVLDALQEAKQTVRVQTGLRREEVNLPPVMKDEVMQGLRDGIPAGYEAMAEAYFKTLAEQTKPEP